MEFKIGDRVKGFQGTGRVIAIGCDDFVGVEHNTYMSGHRCENHIKEGKPGKDGYCWWYRQNDLEKIGGNNMKIKDLKYGDIVTLRNGDRLYYEEYEFRDFDGNKGNSLCDTDDIRDGLTHKLNPNSDIVKVERPVEYETVYKRDDVVELTVDEISEKLGYKVKVVGEDR